MDIYVKEWPNRAVTLFTDSGEELCTCPDMESAARACRAIISGAGRDRAGSGVRSRDAAGRQPSGDVICDADTPKLRRARE